MSGTPVDQVEEKTISLKIVVGMAAERTLNLSVSTTHTLSFLRSTIAENIPIPAVEQDLVFGNKKLPRFGDDTLGSLGLEESLTLMRAAPPHEGVWKGIMWRRDKHAEELKLYGFRMDSNKWKKNNKKHDDPQWSSSWCYCFDFEMECCIVDTPKSRGKRWTVRAAAVYNQFSGEMYVYSMPSKANPWKAMYIKFEDGIADCRVEGYPKDTFFELIREQGFEEMEAITRANSAATATTPTSLGTASTQRYQLPQPIAVREVEFTDITSAVQRGSARMFPVGTRVEVQTRGKSFQDGLVIEHAPDGGTRDGGKVRGGSMKVWYDQGTRVKWVAPSSKMETLIPKRPAECPSLRPWGAFGTLRVLNGSQIPVGVHPDEALISVYDKIETTAYVEVHLGYIQWWNKIDSARAGKPPDGYTELRFARVGWLLDMNAFIVWPVLDPDNLNVFILPTIEGSEGLNWIWKLALKASRAFFFNF